MEPPGTKNNASKKPASGISNQQYTDVSTARPLHHHCCQDGVVEVGGVRLVPGPPRLVAKSYRRRSLSSPGGGVVLELELLLLSELELFSGACGVVGICCSACSPAFSAAAASWAWAIGWIGGDCV